MIRAAVTGASGFIGSELVHRLASNEKYEVVAVVRSNPFKVEPGVDYRAIEDLSEKNTCKLVLNDVDVLIHCAARVHILNEKAEDSLSEFRKTNVDSTLSLARRAAYSGVRRFVFISSVKVNGEGTLPGQPFTSAEAPAPIDPYGVSKWEAEQQLRKLSAETGMELVIIRPVLVYGPDVKANFLNMMKWLYKGVPLPLGAIHNKRSLVALDNLVDLIVTCIDHPRAANQTFLVSDGEDLSTTELLQRMSQALGKRPRLLPVPAWLLEAAAKSLRKHSIAQRLCGSLQVDISHTRECLGWTPPVSVDAALRKTAQHFLEQQRQ